MFTFKKCEDLDFAILKDWWKESHILFNIDSIPDSTYIVSRNGLPVISGSLFLMNCPNGCMVENVIANPCLKGNREGALEFLFENLEQIAKDKGYKSLVIFSYKEKVKDLYTKLGFMKTLDNVTTFCKELN